MKTSYLSRVVFAALAAVMLFAARAGLNVAANAAEATPPASQLFAAATPDDVFKEKGLSKLGFLLVSSRETEVRTAASSVRTLKAKVAIETNSRASGARSIQIAEDEYGRRDKQLEAMNREIERYKNQPDEYNRRVGPYNDAVEALKKRRAALEELHKKVVAIPDSRSIYNDEIIAAAEKADALMAVYDALAKDPATIAAIAQANKAAAESIKLGPSGACAADVAFISKCVADMAADGVPVRMNGLVPTVQVIINGQKHDMLWDSGASTVFLSADSADKLGLKVTDADPTVKTEAADGRLIECRQIVIAQVRLGPFMAKDVVALVAPPGDSKGDDLLGGTFQNHFQCRLDAAAGVLHLTPNPVVVVPRIAPGPEAVKGDIFAARGLTRSTDLFVSTQEADIHAAILSLKGLKTKVASETNARSSMTEAVEKAWDIYYKLSSDLVSLDEQMKKAKGNEAEYNRLVDEYNATLKQARVRGATFDDLRKKLGKMQDSQSQYNSTAFATARQANAVMDQYARLTKDAALKAEIDKLNKTAGQQSKLGPSATFAADVTVLRQMIDAIIAEGVPVRMAGGVPRLDVTINGKTIEMIWDSGASFVSLSSETAAELGLHATDKDQTVTTTVADGKQVQSKLIVVPSITVGGYTAVNVQCIIDPPGEKSPSLLGITFQAQFLCKLDQQAGVLHLTPNDKSAAQPSRANSRPQASATPAGSGTALPAPPASSPSSAPPAPSPPASQPPMPTAITPPATKPGGSADSGAPAPPGMASGLVAELFHDQDFHTSVKKRIDRQIYFEWQNDGPDADIPGGHFSIRWSGMIKIPRAGGYTFEVSIDDDIDLLIDGQSVLSQHGPSNAAQGKAMLAAGLHPIQISYRNTGADGRIMLQWEQKGGFAKQGLGRDVLWHDSAAASDAEAALPGWKSALLSGHAAGSPFREYAPAGYVLVGFEITMNKPGPQAAVQSLQAIYRNATTETMGKQFGEPKGKPVRIVAKPGFAIGAIRARSADHISAMSVRFMRLCGDALMRTEYYDSPWFGGKDYAIVEVGEANPVIGIYGIAGHNFDGLGLLTRD